MSFIEGVIGKVFPQKGTNTPGSQSYGKIHAVHGSVARIFGESNTPSTFRDFCLYDTRKKITPSENGFHPGFSFDKEARNPSFQQGIVGIPGDNKFKKGLGEEKSKEFVTKGINLQTLSETSLHITKDKRSTLKDAEFFSEKGEYQETLPLGTEIFADISKPLFSSLDPITRKPQAYMAIKWYIHKDSGNNESITPASGFIRTSWLDHRLQEKKIEPVKPPKESTVNYKASFDSYKATTGGYNGLLKGFLGPDGIEIDPDNLKAVTIIYFGKEVAPKVIEKIKKTEEKIGETREEMKTEFLKTRVPLSQSTNYKIQLDQIQQKKKMESIQYSIKNLTLNGEAIISDPNLRQILTSLQKTPKWQELIQKAAYVQKAKRKMKSRKK